MKKVTLIAAIAAVTFVACDNGAAKKEAITLNNEIDSVSYGLGMNFGKNFNKDFAEGNFEALLQGINDAVDSANMLITDEAAEETLRAFFTKKQAEMQQKQQAEAAKQAESEFGDVKEEGLKFLAENATKEGVVSTASGLQYVVLKAGSGAQPVATSNVTVHYHGTTPDGTVFDSSVERGEAATFGLNQVISGWTEGVALMKEGAKYRFFIPQELAYGANPRPGGPIKPFMPLVFDIELIKVNN